MMRSAWGWRNCCNSARFNNVSWGDVNRVPGCQGLAITLRVRTLGYTIHTQFTLPKGL